MSEELDVSMKCVQYMLFVSNFLFVMVALLLISIGTIVKAMYTDFDVFLSTTYFSPSNLIIISGFIIFFVAFFGCWGAIRESTLLINVYGLFLIIILVLEVVAVIIALCVRGGMTSLITDNMKLTFRKIMTDAAAADVFDFTQSSLSCCGVNDQRDWQQITGFESIPPPSCCIGYDYFRPQQDLFCKYGVYGTHTYPCANELIELISQTSYLLTIGALCVSFIQVLGIVFARMLAQTIRTLKTQRLIEADLRRQQIYSQIILGATLGGDNGEKLHSTAASEA